jgi:hypothetical protein
MTDTGKPFEGDLTGRVGYFRESADKKDAILGHQKKLMEWLGIKYRRKTVGVGDSIGDAGFVSITDYPMLLYAKDEDKKYAYERGYFDDETGKGIYVRGLPWPRWEVLDDEEALTLGLNIVTSDRFPVIHNASMKAQKLYSGLPLWRSKDNQLNERFYQGNPLTEVQVA